MAPKFVHLLSTVAACGAVLAVAACSTPAQPTPVPRKQQVAPTKAPEATEPAPTAAPKATEPAAPTKAPVPTKAEVASGQVQKPQGWPNKAVSFIVPYPAGGGADVAMRLLAASMEKVLGSPVQVTNKAGAGGQVGLTDIAMARPDGYTIGVLNLPQTITIYLDPERKAQFKRDSFELIAGHSQDPDMIVVRSDSKYKSLKDLVDDARARPEQAKVGSTGILTDKHLALMQLEKLSGARFAIVQFEGGAPGNTALLGGHIDAMTSVAGPTAGGDFRGLAVLDSRRSEYYPGTPTAEEQGYKLYYSTGRVIGAPKGVPRDIVRALSQTVDLANKDPNQIQKAREMGVGLRYVGPEEMEKEWNQMETELKPLVELWLSSQKK